MDAPPPPAPTTAIVALYGRTLRYAEVERRAEADAAPYSAVHPAARLRRLGTCDFDFAVDEAVLGLAGPARLDTVSDALSEIFGGTGARTLTVVAHPPALTTFFTPLPEGLAPAERYEQLRQEAALLADAATTQPVRIRATPVRTQARPGRDGGGDEAHRWHHVLHVPEPIHARLSLLARAFGLGAYDLVEATEAAAAVGTLAPAAAGDGEPPAPFALTVGSYPTHAEFAVCQTGGDGERPMWHFGHHAPGGAPEDAAYFALALLERLGIAPTDVGRLFVYGEDDVAPERHTLLADVLGRAPEPLDPLVLFDRAPAGLAPAARAAFAPCLGAALRGL